MGGLHRAEKKTRYSRLFRELVECGASWSTLDWLAVALGVSVDDELGRWEPLHARACDTLHRGREVENGPE